MAMESYYIEPINLILNHPNIDVNKKLVLILDILYNFSFFMNNILIAFCFNKILIAFGLNGIYFFF